MTIDDPAAYNAWYGTPRGRWIGAREFILLRSLLGEISGCTMLDVGCGTGYFSRHFARIGLTVTGIDPDRGCLEFAGSQSSDVSYLQGSALALPFPDSSFDHTVSVTSLCFISEPLPALQEMWRVTRNSLVLGLLNRHSLLYLKKSQRGGYRGARWDTVDEVAGAWLHALDPAPVSLTVQSAVFLPDAGRVARWCEQWLPGSLPWGGFLAVAIRKQRLTTGLRA